MLRRGAVPTTWTSAVRRVSGPAPPLVARGRRPVLAIRREMINAWERRCPFAPSHVKKLTKQGIKVLIQPSNRRAFPIQEFVQAGAVVQEDLSEAQLIISVKTVPIDQLIPEKTYAFFSHTIKAQPDNMPLLDTVLQRKIRLIDYEKMVDQKGRRVVYFGKWAGRAGMIDILHGIGLRLLALGHHTPFLHIGLAHNYRDLHMAINAFRDCGYEIALGNMPRSLGPLIFVFTGTGNVSQGVQELFEHLPHEYVDVATLPKVATKGQSNKVYGCVVGRSDHYVPKNGGVFNKEHFDEHPEDYVSKFASEIAPYASVIVNGIYWDARSPRLITIPDAKMLLTPNTRQTYEVPGCPTLPHRLIAICDISADPGGSMEFMTECTTIDRPFTIYDADFNKSDDSFANLGGCLVCSIDNMPAQMPIEASEQFGGLLLPFITDMLNCSTDQPFDRLVSGTIELNMVIDLNCSTDQPFDRLQCREEVKNAIIASDGRLSPKYEYIAELRMRSQSAQKARVVGANAKRVLLLGAGMVSGPVADYFAKASNVALTVATETLQDGQRLMEHGPNIISTVLDVNREPEALNNLIRDHDLCISLLPYTLHLAVAKLCIKNRRNMVTTSYISPELRALDQAAKDAEVTIMNEAGLDPGIDHMLAMECIDRVHQAGGKIISFESFCGGLPAPEVSDNPLRYKFSWSPKGMLLALLNPARYYNNGELIEIPGGGAVLDRLFPIDFMPGFNLIGYANRDSTQYADVYGIADECRSLIRGTLRYKGFVETIKALKMVGLLNTQHDELFDSVTGPDLTWKEIMASLLHQPMDIFPDMLKRVAGDRVGDAQQLDALDQLGLFSDKVVERHGTALDTLAPYLSQVLALRPGERDLVILNHDIGVQLGSGIRERHRVNLVAYGEPKGFSAMARTVGYTCAIVADMILKDEIQRHGLLLPLSKDIYRPALKRLRDLGIVANESVTQQ